MLGMGMGMGLEPIRQHMKHKDKVVLISGAARGIGAATARRFAAEGAKIAASDINEEALTALISEIQGQGVEAISIVGDVSRQESSDAAVAQTLARFSRLDILINNAGITRDGLSVSIKEGQVRRLSPEFWEKVLAVNLTGTFYLCVAAALPMIEKQSGRIINTSSVGALGNFGQANYSASKAGVIGLTKTLALEFARHGITVNAVAPGAVKTPMTAAIPEKIAAAMVKRIPLRRFAEPEEIASIHSFLASADAAYITGQVIWADGGLTVGA